MQEDTIAVSVVNAPRAPQAVIVNEGATVRGALNAAGVDFSGKAIRLDGQAATLDDVVDAGSRIILTAQLKGN